MPKFRSYNNEIKYSTAQILDFFNDIVIDRRDGQNNVEKLLRVPCVYGNRSRILKSLENKNKTLSVPLIVLSLKRLSKDSSRVNDINRNLTMQYREGDFDPATTRPVPLNLDYELTLVSKFQEDVDEMMTNFIPFANPDFYVVLKHPKLPGVNLKCQVVWSGDIPLTYPEEMDANAAYRCIGTTTFTFKTWVFPGMGEDFKDGPVIHKINFCPRIFQVGEDGYMLDRWYDVPRWMTFDDYRQNIICGLIMPDYEHWSNTSGYVNVRDNSDWLRISGGYDPISGTMVGLSGYWQDISGVFAYAPSGSIITTVTGDICYLMTQEGYVLLYVTPATSGVLLTPGMQAMNYLGVCDASSGVCI